jgi:hypothetical protein
MIRIEGQNRATKIKNKEYLTEVCKSLTEYLGGTSIKIGVIKGTNLGLVASSLREIAEMFDCAEAIMARTDDNDVEDDPFARPSDDDYDPADFWKP